MIRSVDGGSHLVVRGPRGDPGTAVPRHRGQQRRPRRRPVDRPGRGLPRLRHRRRRPDRSESFRNPDPAAFYDCMAFTSKTVGYAMSDPVDGVFRIIRTEDGGHTWEVMDSAGMPPARDGEFGFAASGTCLQSDSAGNLHLATGGVDPARVFTSRDGGDSWSVVDTPWPVAPRPASTPCPSRGQRGVAVGGDYAVPDAADRNAGWTADGGRTWHAPTGQGLGGYRSGSAAGQPRLGRWRGARGRPDRLGRQPRRRPVVVGVRHRQLSTAWSASRAARATPPVRRVGWPSCSPGPAPLHPTCGLKPTPRPGSGPRRSKWEGVSARRGTLQAARAPRGAGGSGRGSGRAGGRSSA